MKNKYLSLFVALAALVGGSVWADETLLVDNFNYSNGLITNEYAYWNPTDSSAIRSPIWELTSGSVWAVDGTGWTGVPDDVGPNIYSTNGNDSSVFRLNTKRTDFTDIAVTFSFMNQGLTSTSRTPPVAWDGLHIWLRYQSEYNLYYTSINRRDNTVVIKKKVPGGPSNGGTYYELTPYVPFKVPYGTWQNVKATAKNNADGSVTIQLFNGSTLLVSAIDNGTIGGPPIRGAGAVGIRGDNANLKFDNFVVTSLSPTPPPPTVTLPSAPTGVVATPGDSQVTISWNPVTGATSYNLYRSRFPGVTKANGYKLTNVTSPKVNTNFINGTAYYMVVTAVNAAGESVESAQVMAIPQATPPPAPSVISAIPGDRSVLIKWDPVPGALSYNLYRSRFKGVTKANGYKITNVISPKNNTGFTNGVTYYMVLTSVNNIGESVESKEVSAVAGGNFGGGLSFAGPAASDLGSLKVFPNPWRHDRDINAPIMFANLTNDAIVKIFTLSGELVKTLDATASATPWDLRNTSGERVASGLYFYLVTDSTNEKKRGTFMVIQ